MAIKGHEPKTLIEAIRHFSDGDVCLDFMVSLRWPDGVVKCPTCGRSVEATDVTHYWLPRHWLYPSPDRYLAELPWEPRK